jgi:hypothetical protein
MPGDLPVGLYAGGVQTERTMFIPGPVGRGPVRTAPGPVRRLWLLGRAVSSAAEHGAYKAKTRGSRVLPRVTDCHVNGCTAWRI